MSGARELNPLDQYPARQAIELLQKLMELDTLNPQQFLQVEAIAPKATQSVEKTHEVAEVIIKTGATGTAAGATLAGAGGTLLFLGKVSVITLVGSSALAGPITLIVGGSLLGVGSFSWFLYGGYCRYFGPGEERRKKQDDTAILLQEVVKSNKVIIQQATDLRKQLHETIENATKLINQDHEQMNETVGKFQSAQNQLEQNLTKANEENEQFKIKIEELNKTAEAIPQLSENLSLISTHLEKLNGPEALSLVKELGLKDVSEVVQLFKRYEKIAKIMEMKFGELENENKRLKEQLQNENPPLQNRKVAKMSKRVHGFVEKISKSADTVLTPKPKKQPKEKQQ